MFAAAPRALRPLALRAYSRTAYAPTPLRLGRLAAGVAVVGSAVFASVPISKPLQLEAATQRRTDPLGVLDPAVLAVSTEYLAQLDMAALVRAWFVYAGSSQSALVAAGPWMVGVLESMRDGVPVVGPAVWWVFTSAMTGTFYAHFVGGPTVPACQPLVDSLGAKGVGLMLNYSAEAAVDGSAVAKGLNELHIGETLHAVMASARLSSSNTVKDVPGAIKPTLLAIKLTGLIFEPALLSRATTALLNSSSYLRGTELPEGTLFPQGPDLSEEDHADLEKLHDGLRSICAEARAGGVRLLMDAEQSWYQPAIDRFYQVLAEEYNRPLPGSNPTTPSIPILHNTYQCYLRSAEPNMVAALTRAQAKGYSFGAKLVRGAYVESERARAGSVDECCVWSTKAQTDDCFDSCAIYLERRIVEEVKNGLPGSPGTGVCFSTHNGSSTRKVLEALREDGFASNTTDGGIQVDDRIRGRMTFAQLLGMADNLTFTLVGLLAPPKATATAAESLPLVVKYVPFASVDQALPYLIRRANENQSLLQADPASGRGGAKGERKAVGREIRRRLGMNF